MNFLKSYFEIYIGGDFFLVGVLILGEIVKKNYEKTCSFSTEL